jgi:hypothetical protein
VVIAAGYQRSELALQGYVGTPPESWARPKSSK